MRGFHGSHDSTPITVAARNGISDNNREVAAATLLTQATKSHNP